jgi:hypothetical protein
VVRIGHPARLLPSVLEHSLEVLTQTSDAGGIVKDIRKEIDEKQASIRSSQHHATLAHQIIHAFRLALSELLPEQLQIVIDPPPFTTRL